MGLLRRLCIVALLLLIVCTIYVLKLVKYDLVRSFDGFFSSETHLYDLMNFTREPTTDVLGGHYWFHGNQQ